MVPFQHMFPRIGLLTRQTMLYTLTHHACEVVCCEGIRVQILPRTLMLTLPVAVLMHLKYTPTSDRGTSLWHCFSYYCTDMSTLS